MASSGDAGEGGGGGGGEDQRHPQSLQGLLKFCMENTAAEDTTVPGRFAPMDEEKPGGGEPLQLITNADPELARLNQDKALASLGLFRYRIPGDGNCLFRAVAQQLKFDQNQYQAQLRQAAVGWMREHSEDLLAGGLLDNLKEIDETAKPGAWPGQASVVALANIFGVNIAVIQGGDRGEIDIQHISPFETPDGEQGSVLLAYLYNGHYDAIVDQPNMENPEFDAWVNERMAEKAADAEAAKKLAQDPYVPSITHRWYDTLKGPLYLEMPPMYEPQSLPASDAAPAHAMPNDEEIVATGPEWETHPNTSTDRSLEELRMPIEKRASQTISQQSLSAQGRSFEERPAADHAQPQRQEDVPIRILQVKPPAEMHATNVMQVTHERSSGSPVQAIHMRTAGEGQEERKVYSEEPAVQPRMTVTNIPPETTTIHVPNVARTATPDEVNLDTKTVQLNVLPGLNQDIKIDYDEIIRQAQQQGAVPQAAPQMTPSSTQNRVISVDYDDIVRRAGNEAQPTQPVVHQLNLGPQGAQSQQFTINYDDIVRGMSLNAPAQQARTGSTEIKIHQDGVSIDGQYVPMKMPASSTPHVPQQVIHSVGRQVPTQQYVSSVPVSRTDSVESQRSLSSPRFRIIPIHFEGHSPKSPVQVHAPPTYTSVTRQISSAANGPYSNIYTEHVRNSPQFERVSSPQIDRVRSPIQIERVQSPRTFENVQVETRRSSIPIRVVHEDRHSNSPESPVSWQRSDTNSPISVTAQRSTDSPTQIVTERFQSPTGQTVTTHTTVPIDEDIDERSGARSVPIKVTVKTADQRDVPVSIKEHHIGPTFSTPFSMLHGDGANVAGFPRQLHDDKWFTNFDEAFGRILRPLSGRNRDLSEFQRIFRDGFM